VLQQVTWVILAFNLVTDLRVVRLFCMILNTRAHGELVRGLLCLVGHDHRRGQGGDWREQASCGLARVLDEKLVNDDQRGHGFDDGDGAGDDAGVVPSAGGENSRGSVVPGSFLWLRDGCWGFETDPEVDVLAVGDTALDTSAPVCVGGERSVLSLDKPIVVFAARDFGSTETRADLKRFGGGYRQHGMSQFGFKLVKTWFPKTRGYVPDDATDGAANRVLSLFCADNPLMNVPLSGKTNAEIRFGSKLPASSSQRSLGGDTASYTCRPLPV